MVLDTEAERSLARDPTTSSDVLERLGMRWLIEWRMYFYRGLTNGPRLYNDGWRYVELGEVVAENPNTPPHVLVELACHFPDAFARNPLAPLLPLECPDLIAALPLHKKKWAVRHEATPASFLIVLRANTSDSDLRAKIDLHIAIAGEVPPETFREELRALLIRDARRLRGKNRKALQMLVQGRVVPSWLLTNHQKDEISALQKTESDDTAKEELARQVMLEIYDDATPVIVFLLLTSPYNSPYDHTLLRSWWGTLGLVLNPRSTGYDRYLKSADRYIRAAAHARERGDEVSLW